MPGLGVGGLLARQGPGGPEVQTVLPHHTEPERENQEPMRTRVSTWVGPPTPARGDQLLPGLHPAPLRS